MTNSIFMLAHATVTGGEHKIQNAVKCHFRDCTVYGESFIDCSFLKCTVITVDGGFTRCFSTDTEFDATRTVFQECTLNDPIFSTTSREFFNENVSFDHTSVTFCGMRNVFAEKNVFFRLL